MLSRRVFTVIVLAAIATGVVAPSALAGKAGPPVLPKAEYKGKDTAMVITDIDNNVVINKLPVNQECKTKTPTNLGDFSTSGLGPFPIEDDGSFTSGGGGGEGAITVKGKFKGNKVTGTLTAGAFKDPAKDFDCAKYSGKFAAKLVKGTGQKPGQVYERDDFSDPDSGFAVFNITNAFSEYLPDDRFRVGLRAPTTVAALRDTPDALTTVEVEVDTLTFGGEAGDTVGVVCQAVDSLNFTTGKISQAGEVEFIRYEEGSAVERSTPEQVPAGLLKTGSGAKNTLELTCQAITGFKTDLTLKVNGEVVTSAISASQLEGKTGVSVSGSGAGTDYNFTSYEARVPKG